MAWQAMRCLGLSVMVSALLSDVAQASERRFGNLRAQQQLSFLSRRMVLGGGPESPENTKGYTVAQPTPLPHPFGGSFCVGLACRFRRFPPQSAMLAYGGYGGVGGYGGYGMATTTMLPGMENVALGIGSPYFCRGLGCSPRVAYPRNAATGPFTSALNSLLKAGSGATAGQRFESMCKKTYQSEIQFCSEYGDVLTGSAVVAGLPPDATVDQVATATHAFIALAKQAEVDMELWKGSLPFDTKAAVDPAPSEGTVPLDSTLYELFPGSEDGSFPPEEVQGGLFQSCTMRLRGIIGKHMKMGNAYVHATRHWCDDQSSMGSLAKPTSGTEVPPGRPDWDRSRCDGMERLVSYALRYDLDVTTAAGEIPEQEVCKRLFVSLGSIHRVDALVKAALPLVPLPFALQPPPGPPTTPPPVALLPLPGPRLPPADDPDLQSLLKASTDLYNQRVQVFHQRFQAAAAKAQAQQEVSQYMANAASGVPAAASPYSSGLSLDGAIAFPNLASFDTESRDRSAARLRRLHELMRKSL
eukprot:TRINITY_DN62711_c0_g1_i1.p1 TRINITY_DN62711_c0_g1~~TRINITY_DN62711_c0_g1_i1.p1  ORF type:complete len:528 (+),score=71.68 TRINITY_DN62711_c0_g1_i1:238-1821(+)